mmetsp:Transcript_31030/g.54469  ORF Transcript_31030/g.54469 Transcript_31030/m.54469 type:complete len:224 (-) Transcript_31030:2852-3523(-)
MLIADTSPPLCVPLTLFQRPPIEELILNFEPYAAFTAVPVSLVWFMYWIDLCLDRELEFAEADLVPFVFEGLRLLPLPPRLLPLPADAVREASVLLLNTLIVVSKRTMIMVNVMRFMKYATARTYSCCPDTTPDVETVTIQSTLSSRKEIPKVQAQAIILWPMPGFVDFLAKCCPVSVPYTTKPIAIAIETAATTAAPNMRRACVVVESISFLNPTTMKNTAA